MDVATFLNNIAFWTVKNIKAHRNFHEGRYWTFNSCEEFARIFGYWNRRKVNRVILKAVDYNLLLKGNFNKHKYDRTSWYSLTDLAITFFPEVISALQDSNKDANTPETRAGGHWTQMTNGLDTNDQWIGYNCPMERSKMTNGLASFVQSIPDDKTHLKNANIKTTTTSAGAYVHEGEAAFSETLTPEPKNKSNPVVVVDELFQPLLKAYTDFPITNEPLMATPELFLDVCAYAIRPDQLGTHNGAPVTVAERIRGIMFCLKKGTYRLPKGYDECLKKAVQAKKEADPIHQQRLKDKELIADIRHLRRVYPTKTEQNYRDMFGFRGDYDRIVALIAEEDIKIAAAQKAKAEVAKAKAALTGLVKDMS